MFFCVLCVLGFDVPSVSVGKDVPESSSRGDDLESDTTVLEESVTLGRSTTKGVLVLSGS